MTTTETQLHTELHTGHTTFQKLSVNLRRYGPTEFPRWLFQQFNWRWQRKVRHRRFVEHKVHDFKLLLDLDDTGISKELFLSDTREEEHVYILQQYLKPGMCILDCGANIGYYTVLMGKLVGPSGKIYAVEPMKQNFDLLTLNTRLNLIDDRTELANIGVANFTGSAPMYASVMSNRHTFHPHEYVGPSTQLLADRPPMEVPVMTVPDFASGKRRIDLIRMDIEGFEVEVFEGLVPALKDPAFGPSILFEVHRPRYDSQKHDMRAPLRAMFAAGYRAKWLAADGDKQWNTRAHFARMGYGKEAIERVFRQSDRALYRDISNEHAEELICETPFIRAAFLERVTA